MPKSLAPQEVGKARSTIEKGRRRGWWLRKGTMRSGFHYIAADGRKISNESQLDRIKSLVIPPAWKYVRISTGAGSPIQAVGMDTSGRVQYLYNQKFAEKKQRQKFGRLERFGEYLPKLREVTNSDLALEGFPKAKVLAVMMRLINSLYIRVGSEKSVKKYKTFGITTLQNRHLTIRPKGELIFEFVGKSHVQQRKILVDADLAAVMTKLKEIGRARKLFNYIDGEGNIHPVKPAEINAYIKAATDADFSAKDFRTWAGTLLAATELARIGPGNDEKSIKTNLVKAIKNVAEQLGNTPTVCRSSYIHPKVISFYSSGKTLEQFEDQRSRRIRKLKSEFEPEEEALLRMLKL